MIDAFQLLSRTEGIIPALEPAHALAWVVRAAAELAGQVVLVNLSGRGDKDVAQMMDILGGECRRSGTLEATLRGPRAAGRKLLVPYVTGGLAPAGPRPSGPRPPPAPTPSRSASRSPTR